MVAPFPLAEDSDLAAHVRELGWMLDACPTQSWLAGTSHHVAGHLISLSNWDRASSIDVAQWMLRRRIVVIKAGQAADAELRKALAHQWESVKVKLPMPLKDTCRINWTYSGDLAFDASTLRGERAAWATTLDAFRARFDVHHAARLAACPPDLHPYVKPVIAPPAPLPKPTLVAAAPTFPYRPKSVRQY